MAADPAFLGPVGCLTALSRESPARRAAFRRRPVCVGAGRRAV